MLLEIPENRCSSNTNFSLKFQCSLKIVIFNNHHQELGRKVGRQQRALRYGFFSWVFLSVLAARRHMEFLGEPSCTCGHAGSFTHCAQPAMGPTSQGSRTAADSIAPQREHVFSCCHRCRLISKLIKLCAVKMYSLCTLVIPPSGSV